ncbi:MAG: hypothetical protein JRH15_18215 [Deltaproteobacteria bacterium]|nr:hypothetical protein [Deltaproteobacteria bacterium]
MLFLSFFALISFIERIALNIGFTNSQTGSVVAAAMIVGLFGALLAGWLGTRIGRFIPLFFSYALTGVTLLLMTYGWPFLHFIISLDRLGRWLVTVTGLTTIGRAVAPFSGGVVVSYFGYHALGWVAFVGMICALAMIIPVGRYLDRNPTEMTQGKECAEHEN